MTRLSDFQECIQEIVQKFVDQPNDVNVHLVMTTTSIVLQISADQNDFGKIIGKKGKTIESLRTICTAIKNTNFPGDPRKVDIEILDSEVPSYSVN